MDDKDGGPAYRMTLRDHFAGVALQGQLASEDGAFGPDSFVRQGENQAVFMARWAYAYADAMIAARGR